MASGAQGHEESYQADFRHGKRFRKLLKLLSGTRVQASIQRCVGQAFFCLLFC